MITLGGTPAAIVGGIARGPAAIAAGTLVLVAVAIGAGKIRVWALALQGREKELVKQLRMVRKQRNRARKAETQLRDVVRTLLSEHHLEDRIERLQRSVEASPPGPRPRILNLVRDAADHAQGVASNTSDGGDADADTGTLRAVSRIPVDDTLARLVLRGSLAGPDTVS